VTVDFSTLTLTDVTRTFGRRRALNRVTLQANAGELVALLGPNGAGKSTLLSILATLLAPTSGDVYYGSHDGRRGGSALRAQIGLLGHDLYIYPELSAAENLLFFANIYRLDERDRRVDEALERAELTQRRDDPVSGFSRGMRQRLALERALLHRPRLVLLDEPFTGLDDAGIEALRERLQSLRRAGCIVLIATHDLETVDRLVDRAVLLHSGTLIHVGSGTSSLRDRYRDTMRNRQITKSSNHQIRQ
jgi:heme exporter protein A